MKEIGILLKKEREKKKLELKEVSQATKINMAVLIAIEEGNETDLPAKPFVRGFIQTYARYLGLDVDQVMAMFLSDVGTTKPQMMKIEPAPSGDNNPLDFINKKWDIIKKLSIVGGVLLLILFVYFLVETINKYEQESKEAVAQKETVITQAANNPVVPENLPSPEPSITEMKSPEPKPTEVKVEAKMSPVMVPPLSPPALPAASPKVVSSPVTSPMPTPTPKPAASPSPKPATSPQQVILEALDNVKIRYVIDNGVAKNIQLKPEQILTLRAQQKININLSDGGSVNIIYNGQDTGVPGNLGQPIDLSYPK